MSDPEVQDVRICAVGVEYFIGVTLAGVYFARGCIARHCGDQYLGEFL